LLEFPREFQYLSLDPNPKTRIPSNFWIEALPVIELIEEVLPELAQQLTRDGITQKLVDKYRSGKIKSVIHCRKIVEAYKLASADHRRDVVIDRLRAYLLNPSLETRDAFDEFVLDAARIQNALTTSRDFLSTLKRLNIQYATDYREDLITSLKDVRSYIEYVLDKLEGVEAPPEVSKQEEE